MEQDENEMVDVVGGSDMVDAAGVGDGPGARAAVNAAAMAALGGVQGGEASSVKLCELPPGVRIGSFEPVGLLSHGLEANSSQRLTHYDPNGKPVVRSVEPPFGSLEADSDFVHVVHGANFAPTGALRCRYGFGAAGDTDAIYVSPTSIACARAAFDATADVPLVVSQEPRP